MTLLTFYLDFYVPLRLRGRSVSTDRLYRISISNFAKTLGREPTLDDLTDLSLSKHLSRMRRDGRAAATANKDRAQLLAIWRFANRRGFVATWPEVTKDIEPSRAPMAWMPDEFNKLLSYVSRLDGWVGENRENHFWRALLLLIIDTGERIGAVRQIEWGHLNGHWVTIPAELRKGKRKDRAYLLNTDTVDAINKLTRERRRVFHWPYTDTYLWQKYKKILAGAGLPTDRRSAFHRIRRTTASAYHAAGHDATEAMGHADRRTTEAYIDARFIRTVAPAHVLAEFLSRTRTRGDADEAKRADAG